MDDLQRQILQIDRMSEELPLYEVQEKIRKLPETKWTVQLHLYGTPGQVNIPELSHFLGSLMPKGFDFSAGLQKEITLNEGQFTINIVKGDETNLISEGNELSILAIGIFLSENAHLPVSINHFQTICEDVPLHWIITPKEFPSGLNIIEEYTVTHKSTFASLTDSTLSEQLDILLDKRSIELLGGIKALKWYDELKTAFEKKSGSIDRQLKVKKQELQQESAQLQKLAYNNSSSELSDFKQKMASQVEKFEKRFMEQLENNLSSPVQGIYKNIESVIDQMDKLEEQKKAKQLLYIIPESFKNNLVATFRQQFDEWWEKEKDQGQALIRSIAHQTESFLKEKQVSFQASSLPFVDHDKIKRLLDTSIKFDRPFEATAQKKKPMDYMMGARMYYMMFLMTASLLGVMATFKEHLEFFVPLTLLLLGLGIYQMIMSQEKESKENQEKNMKSARESLSTEFRRILTDISRQIEKMVVTRVREVQQQLLKETEFFTTQKERMTKEDRDQKRQQLDQVIKSLPTQDSRMQPNKITLEKDISKFRVDLMNASKQYFEEKNK